MSDDILIAVMIGFIVVGTFAISFAIDFIDLPDGEIEVLIDRPKAIVGIALLLGACGIAAAVWPV